jgi:hypothetical protein
VSLLQKIKEIVFERVAFTKSPIFDILFYQNKTIRSVRMDVIEILIRFSWVVICFFSTIVLFVLYLIKTTEPPDYQVDLPKTKEEALKIVNHLTSTPWRVMDRKMYLKKGLPTADLGNILEIKPQMERVILTLYFPKDHPQKARIPQLQDGQLVEFELLKEPLDLDENNPTSYIKVLI